MDDETIHVVKKNGVLQDYEPQKIRAAVKKASLRTDNVLTGEQIEEIEKSITSRIRGICEVLGTMVIGVAEVHGVVEATLRKTYPDVWESYSTYRNYKLNEEPVFDEIMAKSKDTLYIGDRENANYNSALISTKGSLIRGYLTKEIAKRTELTKTELQIIEDGYLYIHDLRDVIFGMNCCLFDMATVLSGGFEMSGVKYKEPKTVLSALQVIGDVTLVATAQQFGGFTIPEMDRLLVPYCKKSYKKYYDEFIDEINWLPSTSGSAHKKAHAYANKKVEWEIAQGMQSLEMKLNTVPCSRGDTAFVTVSFGCVDTKDYIDAFWQRKVAWHILNTRMVGQGNGSPVLFPKLTYFYSEEQHKNPEQQELFRKAVECNSRAMYPDYISLDAGVTGEFYRKHKLPLSSMGCRSFLSEWKDPRDNKYKFNGRANVGVISLNLPMIWKKSEGRDFWTDLEYYLQIMRKYLTRRYEHIAAMKASTNPLCFTQGGMIGGFRKPDEEIGMDIVKSFTASFGVTALNELNMLHEGKPLHKSDRRFVNKVMDYINDRIEAFKKEDGFLYSVYGVPAESLCKTQVDQFRKKFGIIPGVSDHDYFTNSFHCHVSAKLTPFEKQEYEHELFHKFNGGHIQYVRLDEPNNLKAVEMVVKSGMKHGFYQGVNFDVAVCEGCGHRPRKYIDNMTCPVCGSDDFTVSVRICGYLGFYRSKGGTRLNDGKIAEYRDRISM